MLHILKASQENFYSLSWVFTIVSMVFKNVYWRDVLHCMTVNIFNHFLFLLYWLYENIKILNLGFTTFIAHFTSHFVSAWLHCWHDCEPAEQEEAANDCSSADVKRQVRRRLINVDSIRN